MVPVQVPSCCRLRRPVRLLLHSHRRGPDSCQATCWMVSTRLCCSPCPWACRGRRDLSSTGSSCILIAGGAFRGCLLIAGRLKGRLVRAYRWRASSGRRRDTRPGGAAAADLSKRTIFAAALRCRPQHVGRVLSNGVGRRRCRRGSNFSRQVRRKSGILAGDPDRGARMARTMVPRHPDYGPPMEPD